MFSLGMLNCCEQGFWSNNQLTLRIDNSFRVRYSLILDRVLGALTVIMGRNGLI